MVCACQFANVAQLGLRQTVRIHPEEATHAELPADSCQQLLSAQWPAVRWATPTLVWRFSLRRMPSSNDMSAVRENWRSRRIALPPRWWPVGAAGGLPDAMVSLPAI